MGGRTNEESLDLFADLLEPASVILSDPVVQTSYQHDSRVKTVSVAIHRHKKEIIRILSLLDGVPEEEYSINLLTLPLKLVRLLNMPEVQELFTGAGQMTDAASSGSAMEHTQDGAN